MTRTTSKLVFSIVAAALCGVVAVPARASEQKAALAKVKAHYQAAAAAYDDGELEKTETELKQALKIAEENGLGEHRIVAQTYVLYGVLEVAGLKDREQGVKFFGKAIDISPAIQVPPTMASKAVLAAFDKAETQAGESTPEPTAKAAEAEPSEEAPAPPPRAEPTRPSREAKAARNDPDREKLVDDLAAAKVSESLQQAEKEKLQREKQEREKELASSRGQAQELGRQKADADKQLADARVKVHDLERDKEERDRQIADLKAHLAQLTKEKQETDKQLAGSQAGEKKAREAGNTLAHDKSEGDRQLAEGKRNIQELTRQKAD
ncbi:MAG TPA: hypothetical protein VKZ18_27270, partial [Polyangia bacterium]|nr:hypothetical protein [Polyangia bacterium]